MSPLLIVFGVFLVMMVGLFGVALAITSARSDAQAERAYEHMLTLRRLQATQQRGARR
jgi:NADH:ubiquinone oxidoreductase subunit 3 (subunit A)